MRVLELVDEIDDVIMEAPTVPFSAQVRVYRGDVEARVQSLRDEVLAVPRMRGGGDVDEAETAAARAVLREGERACVARLVELSRAARDAPSASDLLRDALARVDELAAMVRQARTVPITGQARLDRQAVYDALDALRAAVPDLVYAHRNPAPELLDEAGARALYGRGEEAVAERLVRLARAARRDLR